MMFDWSFKKLKNRNLPFYIPRTFESMYFKLVQYKAQFKHIQNRCFVKNDFFGNQLHVFDELGKTLKIIELTRNFKFLFDTSDNLIILQNIIIQLIFMI